MRENARIRKLGIKELKTMNELAAAQRALLHDMNSGAVTAPESHAFQKQLNALQQKWQKQLHKARTPAEVKAVKAVFHP